MPPVDSKQLTLNVNVFVQHSLTSEFLNEKLAIQAVITTAR